MNKPIVAIIGRPNVGKSTLVNRIVGARKAIVDDLPGVTRDRAYYDAEWLGKNFILVDTGGLVPNEDELFTSQINEQVMVALEEAQAVIFVVDALTGITDLDEAVTKLLRPLNKPVFVAVNKVDKADQLGAIPEFYQLGLGDPQGVSAMHGTVGVGDLLDKVIAALEAQGYAEAMAGETESSSLRLAFVGRPNVGKSSLVNRLIGNERSIVSDVAGTTRDAIDTDITWQDNTFTLVDTAGIRRKSKVSFGVELFSVDRAIRSMKRADISILVLDAAEGVTDQDKRLIETSCQAGRGLIIVINKWDTIPNKGSDATKNYKTNLYRDIPHAKFAPVVFTSAVTGQRLDKILETALFVQENRKRRIQTSVMNQVLAEAFTLSPPPPIKNKRLKLYYGTQVSVEPPTFLLFVNSDKLLKEAYKRYLEHRLRDTIELTGTPIVLAFRSKDEKDTK